MRSFVGGHAVCLCLARTVSSAPPHTHTHTPHTPLPNTPNHTLCLPGLVYVFLPRQLLARLVRDYGRAGRFITAGGASSLLALPGESAFEGSTALLAVVFR